MSTFCRGVNSSQAIQVNGITVVALREPLMALLRRVCRGEAILDAMARRIGDLTAFIMWYPSLFAGTPCFAEENQEEHLIIGCVSL